MNKVNVNIQGLDYTLKGDESIEHLNQIGFTVNHLIDTMMRANKKLNVTSAAILTSCNLVDEKFKLEKKTETIKDMEKDFQESAFKYKEEIEKLNYVNKSSQEEIENLKNAEKENLKKKEEEIRKLMSEVKLLQESIKQFRDDNEGLSKTNKELKFELQSYKYKVLDLQNKLFENQMNIVKDKKINQRQQIKTEEAEKTENKEV